MMKLKLFMWENVKTFAKQVWFHEGQHRRALIGPYAGLKFTICAQMKTRMIVFYGAYEADVTKLLSSIVRPGMVFFDVGAHIGIHALYVGKVLKGSGVVYAFEPFPDNFQVLQQNIAQNHQLSIPIVEINNAVGNGNGSIGFTRGATDGLHHLTRPGENETMSTQILSLDSFVESNNVMPDLIMVDVEGGEIDVLLGSDSILRRKKPGLILEHHGKANELTKFLEDRGYCVTQMERHIYAE